MPCRPSFSRRAVGASTLASPPGRREWGEGERVELWALSSVFPASSLRAPSPELPARSLRLSLSPHLHLPPPLHFLSSAREHKAQRPRNGVAAPLRTTRWTPSRSFGGGRIVVGVGATTVTQRGIVQTWMRGQGLAAAFPSCVSSFSSPTPLPSARPPVPRPRPAQPFSGPSGSFHGAFHVRRGWRAAGFEQGWETERRGGRRGQRAEASLAGRLCAGRAERRRGARDRKRPERQGRREGTMCTRKGVLQPDRPGKSWQRAGQGGREAGGSRRGPKKRGERNGRDEWPSGAREKKSLRCARAGARGKVDERWRGQGGRWKRKENEKAARRNERRRPCAKAADEEGVPGTGWRASGAE